MTSLIIYDYNYKAIDAGSKHYYLIDNGNYSFAMADLIKFIELFNGVLSSCESDSMTLNILKKIHSFKTHL